MVEVVVRSTTPTLFSGVDRVLVLFAIGCGIFRVETGDFDTVGVRREVRFVGGFDGVSISTISSSSSDTIAARGVTLRAGETMTTCGVVFPVGGVYVKKVTDLIGVVGTGGNGGLGIGAWFAVRRNMLLPNGEALVGGLVEDAGTVDEGVGANGPVGRAGVGRVFSLTGRDWPKYGAAEGNPSISENLRNGTTLFEVVLVASIVLDFETDVFVRAFEARRGGT